MQTINWKGHGAMFGANAIWGLMSPVAKFVMLGGIVTPLAVTDLRIVGAMILFWILSFFRKSEHVPPKDLAKLFGASLLGVVLNQGSFILGVGMTSPVNASIITTSMPLWAMILAAIFLKEPITAKKVLGIAAGNICCSKGGLFVSTPTGFSCTFSPSFIGSTVIASFSSAMIQ